MIQSDVNSKIYCVGVKTSKMTVNLLLQAMQKTRTEIRYPTGKQTLEQLGKQNQGMTSVELNNPDMREIENTLAK